MKILIADDSSISRQVIERMVRDMGQQSVCDDTGLEAIDRLGDETFDLILMDVRMPVMDGV